MKRLRLIVHVMGVAALLAAAAGCATNPVTGRSELMLVSPSEEIAIDRQASPGQLSSDYGAVQDAALNAYVSDVGRTLVQHCHRPQMPYSFRVVNAVYANAYAFPGGTIAITRGLLIELRNEAELAALLSHELAHVNARHTARAITRSTLFSTALGLGGAALQAGKSAYTDLVMTGGQLLGGAGLARYSRDQEREADAIGMNYLVAAGYDPQGMVGLMTLLTRLGERNPLLVERLFSSHPMSAERLESARRQAATIPAVGRPSNEARFRERTAALRAIAPAIRLFNQAEQARARGDCAAGVRLAREGLALAPNDYAGLLILAACQNGVKQPGAALVTARQAAAVNPREPNAQGMIALTAMALGRHEEALAAANACERALPSDPHSRFIRRYCQEQLDNTAASEKNKR
ncbi:MAG: peptidase M48 Ste24p [Lentisphaerae bacterium]|nr:peptidase M48 Ste24p [Lentisphaerota bacterium]